MPAIVWRSMRYRRFIPVAVLLMAACQQETSPPAATTEQPVEKVTYAPVTELVDDAGWAQVQSNCSGCHSLSLVTQNRMTRSNWISTIRWMQKKQGLWDLGDNEVIIVDYLEKHYGVADVPWRRKPLNLEGTD